MASAPPLRITLFDLIDALLAALVIVQGGIGALQLPDGWSVIAPMAVAATAAFLARLIRKAQVASAEGERSTVIGQLADQIQENQRLRGLLAQNASAGPLDPVPDGP